MKEQRHYQAPRVLKEVSLLLEEDLLATSIVNNNFKLESAGQEVNNISADTQEWNNAWSWE